jgi:hypothetical protein
MNSQREDDVETAMNAAWETQNSEFDHVAPNPVVFTDEGVPILGDYVFGMCLFPLRDHG